MQLRKYGFNKCDILLEDKTSPARQGPHHHHHHYHKQQRPHPTSTSFMKVNPMVIQRYEDALSELQSYDKLQVDKVP